MLAVCKRHPRSYTRKDGTFLHKKNKIPALDALSNSVPSAKLRDSPEWNSDLFVTPRQVHVNMKMRKINAQQPSPDILLTTFFLQNHSSHGGHDKRRKEKPPQRFLLRHASPLSFHLLPRLFLDVFFSHSR